MRPPEGLSGTGVYVDEGSGRCRGVRRGAPLPWGERDVRRPSGPRSHSVLRPPPRPQCPARPTLRTGVKRLLLRLGSLPSLDQTQGVPPHSHQTDLRGWGPEIVRTLTETGGSGDRLGVSLGARTGGAGTPWVLQPGSTPSRPESSRHHGTWETVARL